MRHLQTPLGDEVLSLKAGEMVTLSGTVYTARDEAHLRIMEDGFPFDPKGAVLYHCGPVVADNRIIVAGPTTSARMNRLTGFMLDAGIRGIIGKGGMSAEVRELLRARAVYFAFTGGCANLAAARMKYAGVHYPELGMAEAVWIIELDKLPLTVAMDAHGGDLFAVIEDHAHEVFQAMYPTSTTRI
ncbi:FumA C-terminus/TtdB family hydratase beta subunit [Methanospirillum hungatei]|uniref:FumA C-terminus/TtdB family hydratase beta subunit n=1 Tax=Methanospirillum hungatei TaxID=2203 RepID=UPI0026EBA4C1|nr:FumA C-terminus/TtdB family hydratase beta subunit [Methanospirillum hungatei]MCA1915289.1 FumA C-terminus/TtdB family hydratase beta subunit [Methanospirillum hungatei]